ncbi:MAG: RNA methyltransferase [Rhodobacteraceae bacterium]|nr:RNA methyltransferase [Paracoccaceae bacterium]
MTIVMTSHAPPVIFVFVRPQLGANLGSAARGLKNFGLQTMRLVDPPAGWLGPDAVARASGAADLLERARIYQSCADAVADCTLVLATTVRQRGLTKTVLTPRAAVAHARRRLNENQKLAFLFGPERTGLANEDITLANAIVTVPTSPDFHSMNIAHCATLLAYEWCMSLLDPERSVDGGRHEDMLATSADRHALAECLIADLSRSDYFGDAADAPGRMLYLRNLINRHDLTKGEIRTLHRVRKTLRDGPSEPAGD